MVQPTLTAKMNVKIPVTLFRKINNIESTGCQTNFGCKLPTSLSVIRHFLTLCIKYV